MIALLSDIHANLEALQACLAHAKAHGARRFAFLGDLVGYGADPVAVLDLIEEHGRRGAVVVQGNHDAAVSGSSAYLNEAAAAAIEWTRTVLTPAHREWLAALPLCVRDESACYVHASAASPERWHYVDGTDAAARSLRESQRPCTFSGHVHDQVLYVLGEQERVVAFRPRSDAPIPVAPHRRYLMLAGSVGQPRDGNPAAAYAIADVERRNVSFHRVVYDNHAAARKVRAARLPESLAYRLERGI